MRLRNGARPASDAVWPNVAFGSWLCENAKTLNNDRKSHSSETVLDLQIEIAFNLRIEMENVIPIGFRFFAFSHSQGHFRTHASQQFRGGGTHLPALRAAHGPFSGNGRPAAWSPPTSFASKTASSPSTGSCLRTRRPKPKPSAGCRCSATGSPTDPPARRRGFLAVRCSPGPGAAT